MIACVLNGFYTRRRSFSYNYKNPQLFLTATAVYSGHPDHKKKVFRTFLRDGVKNGYVTVRLTVGVYSTPPTPLQSADRKIFLNIS